MKITFVKMFDGALVPYSALEEERMKRFKTGDAYEVEIRLPRNNNFHRKVFAFFKLCFEYMTEGQLKGIDPQAQLESMRNDLTIAAGFSDTVICLRTGEAKVTAKSLAFDSMDQEEFERCYQAMIQASIELIFKGDTCEDVYERLSTFM